MQTITLENVIPQCTADIVFQLISSVDPSVLKLTKIDSQIYEKFREDFQDFNVCLLNEDEMKSAEGKEVSPATPDALLGLTLVFK